MSRPARAFALGLVVLIASAGALSRSSPAAGAKPLKIASGASFVKAIGSFRPQRRPTIAAATRAFGRPSQRRLRRGGCEVRWRRLGLVIQFYNFGGAPPGSTVCTPSVGRAQSFVATGRRFRTRRGLRIGASRDALDERHPDADRRAGGFWLVTAVSPFGDNSEYGVLRARVRDGRVFAFAGEIGAAGE